MRKVALVNLWLLTLLIASVYGAVAQKYSNDASTSQVTIGYRYTASMVNDISATDLEAGFKFKCNTPVSGAYICFHVITNKTVTTTTFTVTYDGTTLSLNLDGTSKGVWARIAYPDASNVAGTELLCTIRITSYDLTLTPFTLVIKSWVDSGSGTP